MPGGDPDEAVPVDRDGALPGNVCEEAAGGFGAVDLPEVVAIRVELENRPVFHPAAAGAAVGDVDVAVVRTARVVHGDARRVPELAGTGAGDPFLAGGRSRTDLAVCGPVADTPAPGLEEGAGGIELHHPVVGQVGDVDVSGRFVDRDAGAEVTAELAAARALRPEAVGELVAGGERLRGAGQDEQARGREHEADGEPRRRRRCPRVPCQAFSLSHPCRLRTPTRCAARLPSLSQMSLPAFPRRRTDF